MAVTKLPNGKYLARVYVGRKAGKVMTTSRVFATKKEARDYERENERAVATRTYVKPSAEVLDAYLDTWLASHAPQRPNTKRAYTELLARYVRPVLGHRRLADILPTDIQKLYNGMTARGLSARTVRYTHAVLHRALKRAPLPRNPAVTGDQGITLPAPAAREMRALSPDEARAFLVAAVTSPHALLFEMAIATGMRPSEYLALKWGDVDRKAGTVTVQRSWTGSGFASPKTKKSRRTIPLPAGTAKRLAAHYLKAPLKDADALVFSGEVMGRPLDERTLVRRYFKPALKAAGLPSTIRLYDLRHTTATLLLAANVNVKIVSERLGHGSAMLTLDTYSHVLPTMQASAAAKLDAMLDPAASAAPALGA